MYREEFKEYISLLLRRKYPPRTGYDIHASDVNSCLHAVAYLRYKPVIFYRYADALRMLDGVMAEAIYEAMLRERRIGYEKPEWVFMVRSEVLPVDHKLICSPDFYFSSENRFVEVKRIHYTIEQIDRFFDIDYGVYYWRLLGMIDKVTGRFEYWDDVKRGDYWLAPMIPRNAVMYGIQIGLYFLAHRIRNNGEYGDLFCIYRDDVLQEDYDYGLFAESIGHALKRYRVTREGYEMEDIGETYVPPSWIRDAIHRLLCLGQVWQYWADVQKGYLFAREVVPGDRKIIIQKFCRHCPLRYEGICEGIIPFKTRFHTDEEKSVLLTFIHKYSGRIPEKIREEVIRYHEGEISRLDTETVIELIRIQEEIWRPVWEEANSKYILDKRLWDYVDKVVIE